MIDLVVPYVNGDDANWIRLYAQYTNSKRPRRFRDYDTIRYLLRSIEQFCPFIDRVFFVVQQDSQVPFWLDANCTKLKIVTHKEFIPSEFLPTFNSNVIELFFNRIKNLSENFIVANDDMVFLKPNEETDWFIDNSPQYFLRLITENHPKPKQTKIFKNILYNDIKLANELCHTHKMLEFKNWHIPIAYNKSAWDKVWKSAEEQLLYSITNSRLRSTRNLSHWVFNYYQILANITKHNSHFEQHGYFLLEDATTKEQIEEKIDNIKVGCFNDGVKNNLEVFRILQNKLGMILPNKSCFEREII